MGLHVRPDTLAGMDPLAWSWLLLMEGANSVGEMLTKVRLMTGGWLDSMTHNHI